MHSKTQFVVELFPLNPGHCEFEICTLCRCLQLLGRSKGSLEDSARGLSLCKAAGVRSGANDETKKNRCCVCRRRNCLEIWYIISPGGWLQVGAFFKILFENWKHTLQTTFYSNIKLYRRLELAVVLGKPCSRGRKISWGTEQIAFINSFVSTWCQNETNLAQIWNQGTLSWEGVLWILCNEYECE